MLFSIFQSDSHGADILRHTSLHANWILTRSAARKLHLAAMERNRRASCGSSSVSSSSSSRVLPPRRFPCTPPSPSPSRSINVPRFSLDVDTGFLPLDEPVQHDDRLIVCDLSAQSWPDLGLGMFGLTKIWDVSPHTSCRLQSFVPLHDDTSDSQFRSFSLKSDCFVEHHSWIQQDATHRLYVLEDFVLNEDIYQVQYLATNRFLVYDTWWHKYHERHILEYA